MVTVMNCCSIQEEELRKYYNIAKVYVCFEASAKVLKVL